jgi:hypothetical protein
MNFPEFSTMSLERTPSKTQYLFCVQDGVLMDRVTLKHLAEVDVWLTREGVINHAPTTTIPRRGAIYRALGTDERGRCTRERPENHKPGQARLERTLRENSPALEGG